MLFFAASSKFLRRLFPQKSGLSSLAAKYHCEEHAMLMKALNSTRERYEKAGVEEKKKIAGEELEQWRIYVHARSVSIPPSFGLTLLAQQRLTRTWDRLSRDNQLPSDQLRYFFRAYFSSYFGDQFADKVSLEEMLHGMKGYMTRFPWKWNLGRLMEFLKIQALASYERSNDEPLLAKQLSAFNYWLCLDA